MTVAVATKETDTIPRASDLHWTFTLAGADLTGVTSLKFMLKPRDGFGDILDAAAIFDNDCTVTQAGDGGATPAICESDTDKVDSAISGTYRATVQAQYGPSRTVPLLEWDVVIGDQVRQG